MLSRLKKDKDNEQEQGSSSFGQITEPSKKVKRESKHSHVQLSPAISIFVDQKLSSHADIFGGCHGNTSQPVVVKLVEKNERNKREAKILSKLKCHSNVISMIETGFYNGGLRNCIYIAMDKCHDENLREFVENQKEISFKQKQSILGQMINGMKFIHEQNIVHLDLKPDNIFFSLDQNTIKIADFGLSEELVGEKMRMQSQFGTNGFRPPESFGKSTISLKTDIFSLGAVFYFVLSNGNNPFGDDLDIQNVNIKKGKVDLSCLLVPNSKTTRHLIKCMLELKRDDRPTISQVSEHPCWTGNTVECDFDYKTFESSDSDPCSDEEELSFNADELSMLAALLEASSTEDEPSVKAELPAPTDIISTPLDESTTIFWSSVVDGVTYTINLHHNGQIIRNMETSNNKIDINGLEPDTEYEVSVRANNGQGDESRETLHKFKTKISEGQRIWRENTTEERRRWLEDETREERRRRFVVTPEERRRWFEKTTEERRRLLEEEAEEQRRFLETFFGREAFGANEPTTSDSTDDAANIPQTSNQSG